MYCLEHETTLILIILIIRESRFHAVLFSRVSRISFLGYKFNSDYYIYPVDNLLHLLSCAFEVKMRGNFGGINLFILPGYASGSIVHSES